VSARPFLRMSVSAIGLIMAQAVAAQETPPAEPAPAAEDSSEAATGGGVEEIVVTATRNETNLQDTPIAITAVTSEALVERSLTDAADLGAIIPNAAFRRAQGLFGPGVSAFIRGIGQHDTNLASEPGVAFYVDDVYYPLLLGSAFDLLDLDHVEVLRGPQGTLFGRNALAGAINLVSKRPSTREASAFVDVTVGSFGRRDARAGFNMPLADNLAISVSAISKERKGYMRRLDFRCEMERRGTPELAGTFPYSSAFLINETTGGSPPDDCTIGRLGGQDVRAVRGQLLWRPTPDLVIQIAGDYTRDNSDNAPDHVLAIDPSIAAQRPNVVSLFDQFTAPGGPAFRYDERFLTGNPFTTYATYSDPIPAGTAIAGNSFYNGSIFRGGISNPVHTPQRNWGLSGKAIYSLTPEIDATLVLGYRDYAATFAYDVDGSPVAMENNRNDVEQYDWSGEFRVSGQMDWVDWVVGLFYYEGKGNQKFSGSSPYNGTLRYQNNFYEPVSKAAFFNATFRPLERLGVTLGGRYSDEKKPVRFFSILDGTDAGSTEFVELPGGGVVFDLDIKDRRFDWKAGLDYKIAEDTLVYASAATGFRLPGFNSRPLQPSQAVQYDGDETVAYELGIKTELFDRKLRINAAAFYTDYKTRPQSISGQEYRLDENGNRIPGTQVEVDSGAGPGVTTCIDAPAGTPGFQCIGRSFFVNTPGKVKGFELELDARPIEGLSINGSMGYARFTAPDIDARPEGSSRRLFRIPEWTASAGIQYEIPLDALDGTVTPRLDWFYQGAIDYTINHPDYNQSGYSVFNGRVTYDNIDHDFSVAVGATNLFNKLYYENIFIYKDIGFPQINGQPARPREWFVQLSKRF